MSSPSDDDESPHDESSTSVVGVSAFVFVLFVVLLGDFNPPLGVDFVGVFVVVAFADTCNPVFVCFPDDDLLLLLSASSRRANNSGDNSGPDLLLLNISCCFTLLPLLLFLRRRGGVDVLLVGCGAPPQTTSSYVF